MQKYLIFFGFLLSAPLIFAQNDDTQAAPTPSDPFEELLQQFDMNQLGNGIFMDTMIIKQFGDLGFNDAELQKSMQEMMKMFETQFQDFNFGDMQDLSKLFEGFDMEGLAPLQDLEFPVEPGKEDGNTEKKNKKKRKSYKL